MGNININGKSAVHAQSDGQLITTDVCLTPPYCVPIAYTNQAESKMADMTASSVKVEGNPVCNQTSNFKISKGDAPGSCAGVMSGSIGQMAEFITFSNDVMIEGKPAVRNGDQMVSNMKNTPPQPLNQPPAGDAEAGTAKAPAAINEEYSLHWQVVSPETGKPMKDIAYSIILDGDEVISGKTGDDGRTEQWKGKKPENLKVLLGQGSWAVFTPHTAVPADWEYEPAELDEADEGEKEND